MQLPPPPRGYVTVLRSLFRRRIAARRARRAARQAEYTRSFADLHARTFAAIADELEPLIVRGTVRIEAGDYEGELKVVPEAAGAFGFGFVVQQADEITFHPEVAGQSMTVGFWGQADEVVERVRSYVGAFVAGRVVVHLNDSGGARIAITLADGEEKLHAYNSCARDVEGNGWTRYEAAPY